MSKAWDGRDRSNPDLVRISRAYRNESDRVFAAIEHPRPVQLLADEVLQDAASMGLVIFQGDLLHPRRHGRNDRVGINLTMRVMQCNADLRTAILKRQYVVDAGKVAQLLGSVRPNLQDQL